LQDESAKGVDAAQAMFGDINKFSADDVAHGRIAKGPVIAVALTAKNAATAEGRTALRQIAQHAINNGLEVQIVVETPAELEKVKDLIADFNASVVTSNNDVVKAISNSDTKAAEVVANPAGFDAQQGLHRLSNKTGDGLNDLFAMLLSVATGQAVNTPEGRFNAGAREGVAFIVDKRAAKAFLSNENNRTILAEAKAKAKAKTGTLDDMQAYGRLFAMAGTALLIALAGGNITQEELNSPDTVALRNALAQAYISVAKISDLSSKLYLAKENEPAVKTGRLYEVWKLAQESNVTAATICASLQNKYARPAMMTLSEKDLLPESLSVDARLMLMMFEENRRANGADLGTAVNQNVEVIRKVLQAG
jgi:hypothetical protein